MVHRSPIPEFATLSDLRAVPDDRVAHLVNGVIYSHARLRVAHSELTGALYRELANTFSDTRRGGPGGWLILLGLEQKCLLPLFLLRGAKLARGILLLVPFVFAFLRIKAARVTYFFRQRIEGYFAVFVVFVSA